MRRRLMLRNEIGASYPTSFLDRYQTVKNGNYHTFDKTVVINVTDTAAGIPSFTEFYFYFDGVFNFKSGDIIKVSPAGIYWQFSYIELVLSDNSTVRTSTNQYPDKEPNYTVMNDMECIGVKYWWGNNPLKTSTDHGTLKVILNGERIF